MTNPTILRFLLALFCLSLLITGCANSNQSNRAVTPPSGPATTNSSPMVTPPSSSNSNPTPAPPQPPSAPSTMVRNLAIIEGVENDSGKVARINSLLAQLDAQYPETAEQIGDMTAGAYNEITKQGHSASIIDIMEAMMTVSEAKSGITYADAVTSYALLRVKE